MTFSDAATIERPAAEQSDSPPRPAPAERAGPKADPRASNAILPWAFPVTVDRDRDALLTDFGKDTLKDRYLLPGESYQDLFARVASAYADDADHAQRLYDYISKLWFMPATPVLSNGGTGRGLPISCYLNSVGDSLDGIVDTWNENVWLAARGGGIGTYWGNVRGIGEPVGLNGKTSGIIPFVRVMDSLTLAISQGSLRRGSAACYLDITHPEIEEFLEIRKPSGDFNRKALNLHHGVLVTDEFMEAVRDGDRMAPRQPQDRRRPRRRRRARPVPEAGRDPPRDRRAVHHLHRPRERGDAQAPPRPRPQGLDLEPVLGDHPADRQGPSGSDRTAVCCLSSLNLESWDEWKGDKVFIEDVMRFLDNVLSRLYRPRRARHGARRLCRRCASASVGLGVMGFHCFLQARGIAVRRRDGEVVEPQDLQAHPRAGRRGVDAARERARPLPRRRRHGRDGALQLQDGDRADREHLDHHRRHQRLHRADPGEHLHPQDAVGLVLDQEPVSREAADEKAKNSDKVWNSILERGGSVQHLDFLTADEKDVYKTSFEIDQRWLLELAGDRTPYIDQAQSLNLFIPADVEKWDLLMLHFRAWELGIKSLYYLRSKSIQRAGFAGGVEADNTPDLRQIEVAAERL